MTMMMEQGPYLRGWYPGLGEVITIERLPRPVKEFLSLAAEEDPGFVDEYIIPTLSMEDGPERIISDLSDAVADIDLEQRGLGEFGNLGKSIFKRIRKAVQRVHTAIAKKVLPKPLRKIDTKVMKTMEKVHGKISKVEKKVWVKYGNIIIEVVGGVLSIIVGPWVMIAANALVAANTAYLKHRQAQRARAEGRKEAAQMQAEADAATAAANRQIDDFYNQNNSWFLQNGMTPDKWAALTYDQKVAFIDAGTKGQLPPGAQVIGPSDQPPPASASTPAPSAPMPALPVPPPVDYSQQIQAAQAQANAPYSGPSYAPPPPYGGDGGGGGDGMAPPISTTETQVGQKKGAKKQVQAKEEVADSGGGGMILAALAAAGLIFYHTKVKK